MKFLIDGQTLTTPDLRRGVGRVFVALLEHWVARDPSKSWCLVVPSGVDLASIPERTLGRVRPDDHKIRSS